MLRIACVRAAMIFAASIGVGWENNARAEQGSVGATALFFSGLDLWRGGNFTHGGIYWSPDGLDREGFTLKAALFGGAYNYSSGALGGMRVNGRQLGAQILPGWRFIRNNVEIKIFAGPELLNHTLSPDDPSASLRGNRAGLRTTAEVWYAPDATTMLAGHASVSTIGTMHDARIAAGWRLFNLFYAGPEIAEFSAFNYRQFRAGIHVTSLRTGVWEWSGALGFARDNDSVSGAYGRISVLTRR